MADISSTTTFQKNGKIYTVNVNSDGTITVSWPGTTTKPLTQDKFKTGIEKIFGTTTEANPGAQDDSVNPQTLADIIGEVNAKSDAAKQKKSEQDKASPSKTGKKACDECDDCLKTYGTALKQLISHIKQVLDNNIVGIIGASRVDKAPEGCLSAPYSSRGKALADSGTKYNADAMSVQPGNQASMTGSINNKKDGAFKKFLDQILIDKFNLPTRNGAVVTPPPPSITIGRKRYGTCAELFQLLKANNDGGIPMSFGGPVGGVSADILNAKLPEIREACCNKVIYELFENLKNDPSSPSSGKGQTLISIPGINVDGSIEHDKYPSVGGTTSRNIEIADITCCLGDLDLCSDFECDGNVKTALDSVKEAISKISAEGTGGAACLGQLRNNIEAILYGEDGLYTRLIQYSIVMNMEKIWTFTANSANGWPEQQSHLNYPTSCLKRILNGFGIDGGLFPNFPLKNKADGSPLTEEEMNEAHAKLVDDCLFYQTNKSLADGFKITTVACRPPILLTEDITNIKIDGNTLEQTFDKLLNDVKVELKNTVNDILQNIADIPITTPEEDKQKCAEITQRIKDFEDRVEVLQAQKLETQKQIIDTQAELTKARNDFNNAKEDFPVLPDPTVSDSPECDRARAEYENTLINLRNAENAYESAANNLSIAERNLATAKTTQATLQLVIDTIKTRRESEWGTPAPSDLSGKVSGGTPGETYAQLYYRAERQKVDADDKVNELQVIVDNLKLALRDAPSVRPGAGTLHTQLQDARSAAANAAKKVQTVCGYGPGSFDPVAPEDSYRGRKYAIQKLIESLENKLQTLQDELASIVTSIGSFEIDISDLNTTKSLVCPNATGNTVSVRGCFISCVENKIDKTINELVSLDLTKVNEPCPELDNANPNAPPVDGLPVNHPGKVSDMLFKNELTASDIVTKISELIESCLNATNNEVPDEITERCAKLTVRIAQLDNELSSIPEPKAPNQAGDIDSRMSDDGSATNYLMGNDLWNVIYNGMVADKTSVMPTKYIDMIKADIDKVSKTLPDGKTYPLSMKAADLAKWISTITQNVLTKRKRTRLEKDKKILTEAKAKCDQLKTINSGCFSIIEQIKDNLPPSLTNSNHPAWQAFYDLANKLLTDAGDPGNPNSVTMKTLRQTVAEHIKDKLKVMCPDPRIKRPELFKNIEGEWQPYVDINEDDMIVVCGEDNKISKVGFLVTLLVQEMYEDGDGDPFNCFWKTVTGWLNSTILCPTDSANRRSIFHNLYELAIQDIADIAAKNEDTRNDQKNNRRGPVWAPQLSASAGPYWFPPPNDYQIGGALGGPDGVGGDPTLIDKPCPEYCGQVLEPPKTGERISFVRRFYYEMLSVYQYLTNLQDMIETSKSAIDELGKGIEYCSKPGNKGKPYIESSIGKNSLLNPENHKQPIIQENVLVPNANGSLPAVTFNDASRQAKTKATINALLNKPGCSECKGKDIVTGD